MPESSEGRTYAPSTSKRPSGAQWWRIANAALVLLEQDPPENRAAASALIDQLEAAGTSAVAGEAADGAPF